MSQQSQKSSQGNQSKSPTTEKATQAAHDALDKASAKAASAEEYVREHASDSVEALQHKREALQKELDESMAKTRSFISKNPIMCAGIAFAAGMLFTALLKRR